MGNAHSGLGSEFRAPMWVVEKLIYGVRQRFGVCRWYGQSRYAMRRHKGDARIELSIDDWFAAGHRFELNDTERLAPHHRREGKDIGGVIIRTNVVYLSQEPHSIAHPAILC